MNFEKRFRVRGGKGFRLKDHDPDFTGNFSRKKAEGLSAEDVAALPELQFRLYAEHRRALLIVLQAMDAGGKDGTIRKVMSILNPQGCRVTSFKAPTAQELAHDFLWRIHRAVPGAGDIGIFNRSHYEDVLIVRVHDLVPKDVWSERYDQINAFEKILSQNNVTILKFFLHISRKEQRERFEDRLRDKTRNWKANPADFEERRYWNDYQGAYEEALRRCSKRHAPWYVIPADHKWFRNLVVARIIRETLERMDPRFPPPPKGLSKLRVPR